MADCRGPGRQRASSIALRLKVLTAATTVAFSQGDFRWGAVVGEEAVALAEELGDPDQLAFALPWLGGQRRRVHGGHRARLVELLERSLGYCQQIGDAWTKASVLHVLGNRIPPVG